MLQRESVQAVPGQRPRRWHRLPVEFRLGAGPPFAELLVVNSQMFGCTLWLSAVTPTRFRLASRSTIVRAPVSVLPRPGDLAVRSADGPAGSLAEEVVRCKVEVRNAGSGHPLALVPDLLLRVSLRARIGVRRDRACSTSTSHVSGMAALPYGGTFSARS